MSLLRNENDPEDFGKVTKKRIFIDSRDRNPTRNPSANSFVMHLASPLKAMKSITLTDLKVPILAGHYYVALVIRGLRENMLSQTIEGIAFPPGTLGVIPLIPAFAGATYAYYQPVDRKNSGGGWKIEFPIAQPVINELYIELYTWGGGAGWGSAYLANGVVQSAAPILYPLTGETAGTPPNIDYNVLIGLEVEHQV